MIGSLFLCVIFWMGADCACPASGSFCDTLVDNSKVLQDVIVSRRCGTYSTVTDNVDCQQEMANSLQPCLQQGSDVSLENCILQKLGQKYAKCTDASKRCEAIGKLVHVLDFTTRLMCLKPGGKGSEDREEMSSVEEEEVGE